MSDREPDAEDYNDNGPAYRLASDIQSYELSEALGALQFMGDDPFLMMQCTNLAMVDAFIMDLEYETLGKLFGEDGTPDTVFFQSAISQMWIFAAYELLRTWRQRVRDVIKLEKSGGLAQKIAALKKDRGYRHYGHEMRASQLERVLEGRTTIDKIEEDLRVIHAPFARLEHIRIALAKHEVAGEPNVGAYAPGYGRINRECGSLDYELEMDGMILGTISRRDIADELRAIADRTSVPTEDDLKRFDQFMNPPRPPDFGAR